MLRNLPLPDSDGHGSHPMGGAMVLEKLSRRTETFDLRASAADKVLPLTPETLPVVENHLPVGPGHAPAG